MKTSRFSEFYKLTAAERLQEVAAFAGFGEDEKRLFFEPGALRVDTADHMIENAVGTFQLPLGIALNFLINGKDHLIPMAIEEPSVVAAASNAAKMARAGGGFFASNTGSVMIGQIQITGVGDPHAARMRVFENKKELMALCDAADPVLAELGGGVKDVEARVLDTIAGKMLIVHLLVDTKDAMGANAVNTMAEAVAPALEKLSGGRVRLRILSNLAIHRLARARAIFKKETFGGADVAEGILAAYAFACADPFRAATHNKGIMNGIVPIVTATGNDSRAIEAGAHSYAARFGQYAPLTAWESTGDGDLTGTIELPMAVGIVGGATKTHPAAQAAIKLLDVHNAPALAEVIASVGLAQNFAALRALAAEGIQKGHMALHARSVAFAADAKVGGH
ncbi:MAG: hydroxymethylglutaryl-CoA reductase, degradative [Clostridiales Family XIII bacterium]|jgi:hydroxymethylglutaryl-CoA reductase|nr:hydroxymethylglutaryl-CoA reductase, degradative [Clostridiales Family XIII bacterium]